MGPAMRTGLDKLRFVTQDIGGGFGNKITSHPQLVAICLLARKLNRPVQWTEWRTDFHLTMSHGNERWFHDTEVAVKTDGTLLGFRTKALDDAGAFLRYEPLGGVIWAQVTPGCYRWRNIRLEFTQVMTNKAPVSPNRGYSRMQHLWFTERIIDIVAHELGLDPVEVRKRNYVRAEDMPYTTPNGCVYDSGDYARMLDVALELIGHDRLDERRRDAEARGRLLGFGIGSTLDSGTNNFGQSRLINPELQFSGNNEVATVKLDIFGEVVVTLGTTPQGQGHETTAAMVVADILGVTPDDVNVRPGTTATGTRTQASPAPTRASSRSRPRRRQGRRRPLAGEIKKLGSVILGCGVDDLELAEGHVRMKANPEAALPLMACGAIINANNAGLPEDLDVTLNARYVFRPHFQVPDVEKKYGNLTLTYAAQLHVALVEVDPETGAYEVVDYVAVDDCGTRIHPQIVEGQVMGATAHALGAATFETFTYDEDGNLLTPNFYDYHVPHVLDMPPLKTGYIESPSPFTPLGTKGMGEGGGAGIHAVCAALQDALAAAASRSSTTASTRTTASGSCCRTRRRRAAASRWSGVEAEGRALVRGAAGQPSGAVLNDPESMAKTMPGVETFDVHDDRHWTANVKIPLGLGGLRMKINFEKTEEREPEFAALAAKGQGVGAFMNMKTSFELAEDGPGDVDEVGGRRLDRRPGGLDGPARDPADREPAGLPRSGRARAARSRRATATDGPGAAQARRRPPPDRSAREGSARADEGHAPRADEGYERESRRPVGPHGQRPRATTWRDAAGTAPCSRCELQLDGVETPAASEASAAQCALAALAAMVVGQVGIFDGRAVCAAARAAGEEAASRPSSRRAVAQPLPRRRPCRSAARSHRHVLDLRAARASAVLAGRSRWPVARAPRERRRARDARRARSL